MKVFEISYGGKDLYSYTDPWGKEVQVPVDILHAVHHLHLTDETVPWMNPWDKKVEQHEVWQDEASGEMFRKDPPLDYYAGSTYSPLFDAGTRKLHWYVGRPTGRLVWAETLEPVNIIPD